MHKRISPHGNFDHIGAIISLVNNFKKEKIIWYNVNSKELLI